MQEVLRPWADRTVGYRSGQTGQTVNLLANAFVGSNPTPTMASRHPRLFGNAKQVMEVKFSGRHAGVAQLARASAFQAEGRGFESRLPLCEAGSWRIAEEVGCGPPVAGSGSSVVERFLGKEEVEGSIPSRSSGNSGCWPQRSPAMSDGRQGPLRMDMI